MHHPPLQHDHEPQSNAVRADLSRVEPRSLRTFTPTQAVLAKSAGSFHWTPEGRRLYDYTSGVLVANLGHNPREWMKSFLAHMGWDAAADGDYLAAPPMTAYNAATPLEIETSRRLLDFARRQHGGGRFDQVIWAASGSEAIQKALWAALARDRTRDMILATRFGFHGKKGLANAVTGSENDRERDPRVRFVSFPMHECDDVSRRGTAIDLAPYRAELEALKHQFGRRLAALITEPYLGGGGSYHPPAAYLQLLQSFCRENDMTFILDEVQANFGRTREVFAFSAYGLQPDAVVLGKGLGNGIPVAAVLARRDLMDALDYGEGSDTWSANPVACAGTLATLEAFESRNILGHSREMSAVIEEGLVALKAFPFVAKVRGEQGGMVWGVEMGDFAGKTAAEWANAFVLACYQGDGGQGDGIHLLGPLAKKVVRVSPPLTITADEVRDSMALMHRAAARMVPKTTSPPNSLSEAERSSRSRELV